MEFIVAKDMRTNEYVHLVMANELQLKLSTNLTEEDETSIGNGSKMLVLVNKELEKEWKLINSATVNDLSDVDQALIKDGDLPCYVANDFYLL